MKIHFTLLLILTLFNSSIFAEELGQLSPTQLIALQKQQNALVLDIRTEKEWQSTGIIPGSQKLQFFSSTGKFNADKWLADMKRLKSSADQPVILVCRSGNRSEKVGKMLTQQLNMKKIYHLSNGLSSWIKTGHKVNDIATTQVCCK